ncbi:hypothetical protein [Desulfosporosinus sp. BG]|nr:hypothetical protein [Desulfosporosinus sp. BG]ODA38752.1 hypothetical protein DSBG_4477 [Desulfosporosinus sp. BG]
MVVVFMAMIQQQLAGVQCEGGTGCRNAYNWVMTDIVGIRVTN